MAQWKVKRNFTTFTVEADTRSKARYQAFLQYCKKRKNPVSFYKFFTTISKVKKVF